MTVSTIRRIHIIGGPGSGKTWLARRLSDPMAAPVCDLDSLFWDSAAKGYGTKAPEGSRDERLREVIRQPRWIVEGVYFQWVQDSFRDADVIVVLTTDVFIRDWRILRRFIRRKLGLEESKKETVRDLIGLLRWNHGYDESLRRIVEFLGEFSHKTVICSNGDEALRRVLQEGA